MRLFDDIAHYGSLAIVGLEKNTGKTETLNYILRHLDGCRRRIAITSIGIDGETVDAVTRTQKPEITIYPDMIFTTAEQFFLQKHFVAEILDISKEHTVLGRLVTARALTRGKVLLTGAADTFTLSKNIANNRRLGVDLTIVDGALSRLSLASPAVTDAMILATGAAFSSNIETLVCKTAFVCKLIELPLFTIDGITFDDEGKRLPLDTDTELRGVFCLADGHLEDLGVESALSIGNIDNDKVELIKRQKVIFVYGILSNRVIDFLIENGAAKGCTIVVKDFSTIFVTDDRYALFVRIGGSIVVLRKTRLVALTVNPTSPQGIVLNSEVLCQRLEEATGVRVVDVRRAEAEN